MQKMFILFMHMGNWGLGEGRSFLQLSRHLNEVLVDNLMCVFVAYLLGVLLLVDVNYSSVPIVALTASLAFALVSASASLRVFSRNRPLQQREKWAGDLSVPAARQMVQF